MLGTLIFSDNFNRVESQEIKDEPGNDWTTSSDKTAQGHKQVDLQNGYLRIFTHKNANHATSVRHEFNFTDGTLALKFRFKSNKDNLKLNFTDTHEKSVHVGHLFNVELSAKKLHLEDLKTGKMNKVFRGKLKNNLIPATEKNKILTSKRKDFPLNLAIDEWHQVYVTIKGDTLICEINNHVIGTFQASGIAHKNKSMIRLLVAQYSDIDDVNIWRKN